MTMRGKLEAETVLRIAEETGLDVEKLQSDMKSPEVEKHIATSMRLAEALGFNGTPAFVIGDQLAAQAQVKLHVLISGRNARLDADGICRAVPNWRQAGVWFCGPAGFGDTLRATLGARGLDSKRFHQELFDMR